MGGVARRVGGSPAWLEGVISSFVGFFLGFTYWLGLAVSIGLHTLFDLVVRRMKGVQCLLLLLFRLIPVNY